MTLTDRQHLDCLASSISSIGENCKLGCQEIRIRIISKDFLKQILTCWFFHKLFHVCQHQPNYHTIIFLSHFHCALLRYSKKEIVLLKFQCRKAMQIITSSSVPSCQKNVEQLPFSITVKFGCYFYISQSKLNQIWYEESPLLCLHCTCWNMM